jgi:hypothetical protein
MNRHFFGGILAAIALCAAGCFADARDDEDFREADLALERAGDVLVGSGTCATIEQINEACPADINWRNHGQYVSCVAHYTEARVIAGDLSAIEKDAIVSTAGQSDIGKGGSDVSTAPSFKGAIEGGSACP